MIICTHITHIAADDIQFNNNGNWVIFSFPCDDEDCENLLFELKFENLSSAAQQKLN